MQYANHITGYQQSAIHYLSNLNVGPYIRLQNFVVSMIIRNIVQTLVVTP